MLHVQNLFPLNIRVPNKLFLKKRHLAGLKKNNHSTFEKIGIHGPSFSSLQSSSIKACSDGDILAPKDSNGIGIEFFAAKNLLVTGATGFLVKGNFFNKLLQNLYTGWQCIT